MEAAQTTTTTSQIPSGTTRILRRYDRDLRIPQQFVGYDCVVKARVVELGGKKAHTLFFPEGKEAAAHRASRVGWIDETAALTGPAPAQATKPPAPGLGAKPAPEIAEVRPAAPLSPPDIADGLEPLPGVRPITRPKARA